jgi:hypothetical protein
MLPPLRTPTVDETEALQLDIKAQQTHLMTSNDLVRCGRHGYRPAFRCEPLIGYLESSGYCYAVGKKQSAFQS